MQASYSSFKQGDVVIVDMHFSNLEESKIRPALVISSNKYNEHGEDMILLKITSQVKQRPFTVSLGQQDLATGELRFDSFIKTDFPVVVKKSKVIKTIGTVKPNILRLAKDQIRKIFEL